MMRVGSARFRKGTVTRWTGWQFDIGGANIKVADGKGFAASHPFPLWRNPDSLTHELRRIISESPSCDHLVATMTGELADCYETKEAGVLAILRSLDSAADGRHTRIYVNDGTMVTPVVAGRRYSHVAAANWHALARYSGRFMELGAALLLDVGSTTTDVIPFRDGLPIHTGTTDTQRLISGELVYTGIQRSPLCAVARHVPYRDHICPLAHEMFATTLDAYVILGDLPEDSANDFTADGRPATKTNCRNSFGTSNLCRQRTIQPPRCCRRCASDCRITSRTTHDGDGTRPAADGRNAAIDRDLRPWRILGTPSDRSVRVECDDRQLEATARPRHLAMRDGSRLGEYLSRISGTMTHRCRVVKLGGSHFELDDYAIRLTTWLQRQTPMNCVIVVGGGIWADAVRRLDRQFGLATSNAHWMAVRAMSLTSWLLAAEGSHFRFVDRFDVLLDELSRPRQAPLVFDTLNFLRFEEPSQPGIPLPLGWHVTSDSIAARVAHILGAWELVLLKARPTSSVREAVQVDLVDQYFPTAAAGIERIRIESMAIEARH